MTITTEAIKEAIKAGYEVTIIINGEHYEYTEEVKANERG